MIRNLTLLRLSSEKMDSVIIFSIGSEIRSKKAETSHLVKTNVKTSEAGTLHVMTSQVQRSGGKSVEEKIQERERRREETRRRNEERRKQRQKTQMERKIAMKGDELKNDISSLKVKVVRLEL
jgi:hypothetical protein